MRVCVWFSIFAILAAVPGWADDEDHQRPPLGPDEIYWESGPEMGSGYFYLLLESGDRRRLSLADEIGNPIEIAQSHDGHPNVVIGDARRPVGAFQIDWHPSDPIDFPSGFRFFWVDQESGEVMVATRDALFLQELGRASVSLPQRSGLTYWAENSTSTSTDFFVYYPIGEWGKRTSVLDISFDNGEATIEEAPLRIRSHGSDLRGAGFYRETDGSGLSVSFSARDHLRLQAVPLEVTVEDQVYALYRVTDPRVKLERIEGPGLIVDVTDLRLSALARDYINRFRGQFRSLHPVLPPGQIETYPEPVQRRILEYRRVLSSALEQALPHLEDDSVLVGNFKFWLGMEQARPMTLLEKQARLETLAQVYLIASRLERIVDDSLERLDWGRARAEILLQMAIVMAVWDQNDGQILLDRPKWHGFLEKYGRGISGLAGLLLGGIFAKLGVGNGWAVGAGLAGFWGLNALSGVPERQLRRAMQRRQNWWQGVLRQAGLPIGDGQSFPEWLEESFESCHRVLATQSS